MVKFLESLALAILIALAPMKSIALAIFVLVLIDTISGVFAAYHSHEAITSSKLKRMIGKLLIYYSASLVGFIASAYLVDGIIPVEKMITTLIGVVEVKSILENLDIIYGGSFFKALIDKLNSRKDE